MPAVARLSIPLASRNQGTICILLTIADSAGARPRKTVTARMAKFDRFLLFSASPERQLLTVSSRYPKTAEIDQGSAGQSCGQPLPSLLSDCVSLMGSGLKPAFYREANLPAHSQPPAKGGSVFFNGGLRPSAAQAPSTRQATRRRSSRARRRDACGSTPACGPRARRPSSRRFPPEARGRRWSRTCP